MNSFAVNLASLIKDAAYTQTGVANEARVTQGQVSNYLNGNTLPEEDVLVRLCDVFKKDAGRLVAAWLRDKTPETLRRLVEISPTAARSSSVMEAPHHTTAYMRLPRRTQKLLDEVSENCERDPRFVTAIESTLSLTRR